MDHRVEFSQVGGNRRFFAAPKGDIGFRPVHFEWFEKADLAAVLVAPLQSAKKGSTHSLVRFRLTLRGQLPRLGKDAAQNESSVFGPFTIRLRQGYGGTSVMIRGDRKEDIFLDDVDRQDFLKTLPQ